MFIHLRKWSLFMRSAFKIILPVFLIFCFGTCLSQTKLNELDVSRIRQKSIQKFITNLESRGIVYFEDLHPSVDSRTDSSKFDTNCHYFRNVHSIDDVWKAYLKAHPARIWNGRVVSLGFIYSPEKEQIIFQEDKYPGLEVGQIFFIEMRVFFGTVHFPVSFVVTEIDQKSHSVSFSYLREGQSKGAQTIQLFAIDENHTKIRHSSIHQTDNVLRDKILYPIYHKKAIKEVHRNIRTFLRNR